MVAGEPEPGDALPSLSDALCDGVPQLAARDVAGTVRPATDSEIPRRTAGMGLPGHRLLAARRSFLDPAVGPCPAIADITELPNSLTASRRP